MADFFKERWELLDKNNGKLDCHICGSPATKNDKQHRMWCQECINKSIKYQRKKMQVKFDVKKIGRNEPCPCGSEKKIKHCCIDKTV